MLHDPQLPAGYFGELTLATDYLQVAEDHGQMLSHIPSLGWAEEKHSGWDQPAFGGGRMGPCGRDLGHTSSWARSSEAGSAPGPPTYIAHVDGSLVNLYLLLGCLWEETCRDEGCFVTLDKSSWSRRSRLAEGRLSEQVCSQHSRHRADTLQSSPGPRSHPGIP